MKISPIKRLSTLDGTIAAIRSYILENHLKVGDPLPPEITFAKELGVSRNIMREAMRHYRTLGIIKSRTKTGSEIASLIPEDPYAGYLPFIAAAPEMLDKLAEVRRGLELGFVEAMVEHATAEQLDELEKLAKKLREFPDQGSDDYFETDIAFHTLLLRTAANPVLDGLLPFVITFFSERRLRGWTIDASKYPPDIFHLRIAEALKNRDAAELRELLTVHSRAYVGQPYKGNEK